MIVYLFNACIWITSQNVNAKKLLNYINNVYVLVSFLSKMWSVL